MADVPLSVWRRILGRDVPVERPVPQRPVPERRHLRQCYVAVDFVSIVNSLTVVQVEADPPQCKQRDVNKSDGPPQLRDARGGPS